MGLPWKLILIVGAIILGGVGIVILTLVTAPLHLVALLLSIAVVAGFLGVLIP